MAATQKKKDEAVDEEIPWLDTTTWDDAISKEEELLDSTNNNLPKEYVESKDFQVWEKYKGGVLSTSEKVAIELLFKELILIALDLTSINEKGNYEAH